MLRGKIILHYWTNSIKVTRSPIVLLECGPDRRRVSQISTKGQDEWIKPSGVRERFRKDIVKSGALLKKCGSASGHFSMFVRSFCLNLDAERLAATPTTGASPTLFIFEPSSEQHNAASFRRFAIIISQVGTEMQT